MNQKNPDSAQVLVITNGPLCRNPRAVKEAALLAGLGHEVTVLHLRNHRPSEPKDDVILSKSLFRRKGLDLLPGLDTPLGTILVRRACHWAARKAAVNWGIPTIDALGPARSLLHAARSIPADLTIVHNELPHWVGTRLLDEGRLVAADLEDWHSEDLEPSDRAHRPIRIIREVESLLLHRAAYTTTTSNALADALHARYGGIKPRVVRNTFPLEPWTPSPCATPPSLFWFSQTIGPGRGLEHFMDAWKLTRHPSRVLLLGEAQAGYLDSLRRRLPLEFQDRLTTHELVPPDALPGLIAQHDIGLALEESRVLNHELTTSNKLFQYMNAGLAVIASDTIGQREVLETTPSAGVLIHLKDTPAFASKLDALLGNLSLIEGMKHSSRKAAEDRFNWESESRTLIQLTQEALSSRDPLRSQPPGRLGSP